MQLHRMLKKDIALPLFFTSLSLRHRQESVFRKIGLDDYQILFVVDGEGELICGGKSYTLKKGCAFFLRPDVPHSYKGDQNFHTAYITVRGNSVREILNYYNVGNFLFLPNVNLGGYISMLGKIEKEYYDKRREGILSTLTYNVFVEFFEGFFGKELSEIEKLAGYIEKNFKNKLTLDELAQIYHSSVSKMCKDFKKKYNVPIFEYILELRLNYAKRYILIHPNVKIKWVAHNSGFNDTSYFCRAYKKRFGTSALSEK